MFYFIRKHGHLVSWLLAVRIVLLTRVEPTGIQSEWVRKIRISWRGIWPKPAFCCIWSGRSIKTTRHCRCCFEGWLFYLSSLAVSTVQTKNGQSVDMQQEAHSKSKSCKVQLLFRFKWVKFRWIILLLCIILMGFAIFNNCCYDDGFQVGYKLHDRVIRPAEVGVVKER